MHPVVEKLLAISALTAAGCHTVCNTPVTHTQFKFEDLEEKAPQVAASTYADLQLSSGTHTPSRAECEAACGPSVTKCLVYLRFEGNEGEPYSADGTVDCQFEGERTCHEDFDPLNMGSCPYGCGRMPAFGALPSVDGAVIERYLAEVAALESLSVAAFAHLARDLREHRIVGFDARIAAARAEERRHARHARRVLRALGVPVPRVARVPWRRRALFDVALDNAVEGCVRETFGAACAKLQAARGELSSFFRAIVDDELRHAALSWDIHVALMERLTTTDRARIREAQHRALTELERAPSPPAVLRERVGLPSRDERAAMSSAMRATLPWGIA